MTSRRGRGEGSVYQRADGRWVAQVEAGLGRDGHRRRPRAVRRTKRDALAALDELRRQAEQGVTPERTQTVGEFLEWWLTTVLPGTVKASTAEGYGYMARRYVIPHVGRVRLAKLTPLHVKSMLRALEDDGLSPRTRQYARAVLRRALRWAEQHGLVVRNVAALVDGPRKTATKLDDTLDAAGAHAVIAAAAGDRLEALAVVVLRLGLRKGEALALRWDDIDLDAGTLAVRGTLKRRRDGGGLYVDTTKTSAGTRELPLVAGTAEALREHRRRQAAERLALGPLWVDSGHVFTTATGTPVDPRNANRWWSALCERAGVGHRRFHAARHTAATLLLDQGVPLEVVSAVLGHAGLAITADVYAKVGMDAKRRALATLADNM
ncbi:MAG: tyrosine-type recombinase/integrase [Acidimicrobiales bacterium]